MNTYHIAIVVEIAADTKEHANAELNEWLEHGRFPGAIVGAVRMDMETTLVHEDPA